MFNAQPCVRLTICLLYGNAGINGQTYKNKGRQRAEVSVLFYRAGAAPQKSPLGRTQSRRGRSHTEAPQPQLAASIKQKHAGSSDCLKLPSSGRRPPPALASAPRVCDVLSGGCRGRPARSVPLQGAALAERAHCQPLHTLQWALIRPALDTLNGRQNILQ